MPLSNFTFVSKGFSETRSLVRANVTLRLVPSLGSVQVLCHRLRGMGGPASIADADDKINHKENKIKNFARKFLMGKKS